MILIFAEIFSFLGAICLCYSTFKKEKTKMVFWQIADVPFNIIANILFISYSGLVANIFSLIRNVLSNTKKFNKLNLLIFCILFLGTGWYFNNLELIGWLPIIAELGYTMVLYKCKGSQALRLSLTINLIMWAIYDFYIMAYPSVVADLLIGMTAITNYIKYKNEINGKEILKFGGVYDRS